MIDWEADKLYLFIAFVIPGFIAIKAYEVLIPSESKDSSKRIIDAIAYSCINYGLLIWPIIIVESGSLRQTHLQIYSVFYLFVLFGAPIVWVLIWKKIRTTQIFQDNAPHPTLRPWDYVFSKRLPYWIKIHLKDGTKIAGKFGSNSFASSSPAPEQIFIEETWILNSDEGFERPKQQNAGTIVLSEDISHVELINFYPEADHD